MIRDKKELNEISDDELTKLFKPFDKEIDKYLFKNFLNEYVAYYIYCAYKNSVLWSGDKLDLTINSAIEHLSEIMVSDCKIRKIKRILAKKYNLRIESTSPLRIENIK